MNIITKSLDNYDSNIKKIFIPEYSIEKKYIIFNSEKISVLGNIGSYINKNKTWTWAWSIPSNTISDIKLSLEILKYGLTLNPDNDENIYLKSELLTSTIEVKNVKTLEKYIALSCYLAKKKKAFIIYDKLSNDKTEKLIIEELDFNSDFILTVYLM